MHQRTCSRRRRVPPDTAKAEARVLGQVVVGPAWYAVGLEVLEVLAPHVRDHVMHSFGLVGHSSIGRFTRRSSHIHNKIPSYCDLRRNGALVHGDWYVLVSDLSKVLGGTLLCGNCCRQGRAVSLKICHGPSVRPSRELQLSSAVHKSAISCGARTPSQTSAHLLATGVQAI